MSDSSPAEGIIDAAESEHVDLIAMGSRSKERKGICCWQTKACWKCGKKSFRDCRISSDDNKVTITRVELNVLMLLTQRVIGSIC